MYYIREFAVYGPRGGTVRSSWQVVHPNGVVVYNGGKKTAQKLRDKWNKEKEGRGQTIDRSVTWRIVEANLKTKPKKGAR